MFNTSLKWSTSLISVSSDALCNKHLQVAFNFGGILSLLTSKFLELDLVRFVSELTQNGRNPRPVLAPKGVNVTLNRLKFLCQSFLVK